MSKSVGFIPLRKGSKGIPNKNRKKMVGRPLFCWVLQEAVRSRLDEVVVYTDDPWIRDFVQTHYGHYGKVVISDRGADTATDEASTESAMLEYAQSVDYNFETICLLQATSPMTTAGDINLALAKKDEGFDAVLSVVRTHRFVWNEDGTPANYDPHNRPRRQDFDGLLVENGAIYVQSVAGLKAHHNRLGGKIGYVEMAAETYHEIDDPQDWAMIEQQLIYRLRRNKEHGRIRYLILDVDGVFTTGQVAYNSEGEWTKTFDMRDGMGLEVIREHGVEVIVMTSEHSELVKSRMKKLKIERVFSGAKDKYALLKDLMEDGQMDYPQIVYIGDDVNDLANICAVGWSMAPNNATQIVRSQADMVLTKASGQGAIREACEWIMKYNQRYE